MKNHENNDEDPEVLSLSRVIKETIAGFCAYGLLAYAVLVINDMYANGKSMMFIPNFVAPLVCLLVIIISFVRWVQFIWKYTDPMPKWCMSIAAFTAVFAVLSYNILIPMLLVGSKALIAEVTAYRTIHLLEHGERDKLNHLYLKSTAQYNRGSENDIDLLLDDFSEGITKDSYKSFRCFVEDGGGFGGGRGAITESRYSGYFYKPIITNSGKQYEMSFRIVLFDRDDPESRGVQYILLTPIGE